MPRQDGTGPMGMGPRTGWGMGPCCRGVSWNRGFGSFWRIGKKERREILEEEIQYLKEDLEAAQKELSEIDQ